MKKIHRSYLLACAFATATCSSAAWADAPRYDFLDLGYQGINDPSGSFLSSDHSYEVDGSYAFTDHLIGAAQYSHETADFHFFGPTATVTGNAYEAGLGYRFALSSNVDLIPNLSYVSEHVSATGPVPGISGEPGSQTGYDAGLLLRAMVTDKLELDANVDHTSPGHGSNDYGVAALFDFTRVFALGLGYGSATSQGQTTTAWTLAARFYFD